MKRIAVLSIFTQTEPYADYLMYYIDRLKEFFDDIIIVSSLDIAGNDFARYKHGLLMAQKLYTDFEIVFTNDTVYGPIYSLNNVWNKMNQFDFWGITKQQKTYKDSIHCEVYPEYIHSYFMALTTKRTQNEFLLFCDEFANNDNPEAYLAQYMKDKGLQCGAYCDLSDIENNNVDLSEPYHLIYPYYLVAVKKSPFVCRYVFRLNEKVRSLYGNGIQIKKLMSYLEEIKYPCGLIYNDQIYQQTPNELAHIFDLIIVPEKRRLLKRKKVAIFVYLYYEKDFLLYINRLKKVPRYFDIIIYTSDEKKSCILSRLLRDTNLRASVNLTFDKGREWSCFCGDVMRLSNIYEMGCFLHDKSFHENEFPTQAYDFRDMLWDNLLPSEGIESIINYMIKKHIGLVLPPIVKHGSYFKYYLNFWMDNYDNCVNLLNKLDVDTSCVLFNESPISLGGMFWFKFDALKQLGSGKIVLEDFPDEPIALDGTLNHALERCLPYIARNNGFYSAFVYKKEYLLREKFYDSYVIKNLFGNDIGE